MLTAFTSTTDIDIKIALDLARAEFPHLNFTGVTDALSLERLLTENEETLYVVVNNDLQAIRAIAAEQELAAEIEASLDDIECPIEPPAFTEEDLEEFDSCEVPTEEAEAPDAGDFDEFQKEIQDILNKQYGSLMDENYAGPKDDVQKILECKGEMEEITARINLLIDREQKIRTTAVALEELLYNYRVMETFYKKRTEELARIQKIFDPLIVRKRELEAQLLDIEDPYQTALTQFEAADKIVEAGGYTNQEYQDWQTKKNRYDDLEQRRTSMLIEQEDVKNSLDWQKLQIGTFNNEQITNGDELVRKAALIDNINGLFQGTSSIYNTVGAFSSRIQLQRNNVSYDPFTKGTPFDLNIENRYRDDAGVIAGRPKTYRLRTSEPPQEPEPSGVLYTRLYNIWGDPERFFTREERGLTTDSNAISPDLKDTGAEVFNDSYIASSDKFTEFYKNFNQKWNEKVVFVKNTVIEPALRTTVSPLETFAIQEVQLLLAFGQAYEFIPADGGNRATVTRIILERSQQYTREVAELRADLNYVQSQHALTLQQIESERNKYTATDCAQNDAPTQAARTSAGTDPLGQTSLIQTDPSNPNPTKWCYWVKFAALATAVNVLPIPGAGGFRYWPVGLLIPAPNGVVKIPLPIIWIPIAVIPLQVGLFVVFIAQCGLCPSPVVFFVGPNGEKKFIVSLRPGTEFGANADKPVIKLIEQGGIAVMSKLNDIMNDIKIPGFKGIENASSKENLLDDIKSTILNKINKIGNPDMSRFDNIGTGSAVSEKMAAFKNTIMEHLGKMDVPSIKIPKSADNVNPKPLLIQELFDQLNKLIKMKLPSIAIPEASKVNLTAKLLSAMKDVKLAIGEIDIPEAPKTPEEEKVYMQKIKAAMKKVANVANNKITGAGLGIMAVAEEGITFMNPYKCKTDAKGLVVPPVPPQVNIGLTAIKQLSNAAIDGLTLRDILNMGALTSVNFASKTVDALTKHIPDVNVPNPSKVSIKDMVLDSAKKVAKMQLPSLPDPTKGIQPRITIPGKGVEDALLSAVSKTIDAFPINDINFGTISAIDLKGIIIDIVEQSFAPLENFLGPFLSIVASYQAAKDKTFPEMLGLGKCSPDASKVPLISKTAFESAMETVARISLIPYPAVAFAPQVFGKMHPVLNSDDLPPWERLTIDNFLFVVFLDQWCVQGKKTCGFFELPV